MPEELGTRDVLEQIDARLSNVEQDLRAHRTEMRTELNGLRGDFSARFEVQTRWLVGLILASWLTVMASIWLKS